MLTIPPISISIVIFFIDSSVKFLLSFSEISLEFWRNISFSYHWIQWNMCYWNFNEKTYHFTEYQWKFGEPFPAIPEKFLWNFGDDFQ